MPARTSLSLHAGYVGAFQRGGHHVDAEEFERRYEAWAVAEAAVHAAMTRTGLPQVRDIEALRKRADGLLFELWGDGDPVRGFIKLDQPPAR